MVKEKFLVGMSGGVDSSVTAALLVEQGYLVIGVTLKLYDYEESLDTVATEKRECHPLSFITDAENVAKQLGIEHHVIDRQDFFNQTVIKPFMESYQVGRTPLPCVNCNRDVKTASLYRLMTELGATQIATGHYVRSFQVGNKKQLHRGADPQRDQSFFLFSTTPSQLEALHFPLGMYSKEKTRLHAEKLGFSVAGKKASQDLCFVSKRSYRDFVTPEPHEEGDIVHENGQFLGRHKSIRHYTIGQRQGLGVSFPTPVYVTAIDAVERKIIVGPRESLARNQLFLKDVNWLAEDLSPVHEIDQLPVWVKVRSFGACLPASLKNTERGFQVILQQPEYGVSPGQACVFYQGTRLLGGGWIDHAH